MAASPNKGGRPPAPEGSKRKSVAVGLTTDERKLLTAAAKVAGRNLTVFIREAALSRASQIVDNQQD